MARAASFLLLLVALAASGTTLVQKGFRPTAPSRATLAPADAATRELTAAAAALERYRSVFGGYHGANLDLFDGLRLVRADETSYCLEVGAHALAGPHGTVVRGGCHG